MISIGLPTIGWPEIVIVLLIIIILFGAKKLPQLARSLGSVLKEFKKGAKDASGEADVKSAETDETPPSQETAETPEKKDENNAG